VRLHLLIAARQKTTPLQTALGFALGCFIGIFPSAGVGTPLAVAFATRLELNIGAAFAGTFVMNPLTAPFFYTLSSWVGFNLLRSEWQGGPRAEGWITFLSQFGPAFLLGITVLAVVMSLLTGLLIYLVVWRRGCVSLRGLACRLRTRRVALIPQQARTL
jgi:uncharacterized protein (DUF2062 family)